jgi:hypothetical protein
MTLTPPIVAAKPRPLTLPVKFGELCPVAVVAVASAMTLARLSITIPVSVAIAIPLNDMAMSPELLIIPADVAADAADSDGTLFPGMLPHVAIAAAPDGTEATIGAIAPDAVDAEMPDKESVMWAGGNALADDTANGPTRAGPADNDASVPHEAASDMPEIETDSASAKIPVAVVDDDPEVAIEALTFTEPPDEVAADTPIRPDVRDIVPVDAVASDPTSAMA